MIDPMTLRAAALLLIGAPVTSLAAPGNTTYRVDPDKGDDSNPAGRPWRTFGRLNAEELAPGDTVIIAPGRQQETLKPSGGGTAEKPVVIRFQPGIHTIGIEDTLRIPMFISNSMDSTDPQPVGILLQNVKHFRLEGSGAKGPGKTTILCDGRMAQLVTDHSENITFTGLAFDLKRPTVSEFRVIESGPTTAEIQIAEGSDHAVENGSFIWNGDWGHGHLLAQEAIPAEGRCWRSKVPRGWDSGCRVILPGPPESWRLSESGHGRGRRSSFPPSRVRSHRPCLLGRRSAGPGAQPSRSWLHRMTS